MRSELVSGTALRICVVSAEVAPLAKTGGLADVASALATSLARLGHDVVLVMPLYKRMREADLEFEPVRHMQALRVELGEHVYRVSIWRTVLPSGKDVLCVDCPALYERDGIYTNDADEHRRFALLTRTAFAICQAERWPPDIMHFNDWHVALGPLMLKLMQSWDDVFARTRSVLTIHNLGYQGVFGAEVVKDLGLEDARHLLHQDDLTAGRFSFLKTGILYADAITTVSETYAREIQGPDQGVGLDDLLRARRHDVLGIVNGIEEDIWDPGSDPHIPAHFDADDMSGKTQCKLTLQDRLGLVVDADAPTFGIVSRLAYQKGFEVVFAPFAEMLRHHDARLVVLGSGEPRYETGFAELEAAFPGKVCFWRGYSEALAHLIEAGADAFVMPSRYEPCGLNQMYSQRYGTVPIVRRTGGLADTVQQYDPTTGEGTGVVFEHLDTTAMRWALERALELYAQPEHWSRMRSNGMARDFSWTRQAGLYEALYHRIMSDESAAL